MPQWDAVIEAMLCAIFVLACKEIETPMLKMETLSHHSLAEPQGFAMLD